MVSFTTLAFGVLAATSVVQALPSGMTNLYFKPPNASRGPCPGLNILANHGYLPRDGRNIDLPTISQALKDAYNFAPDFTATVFGIATNPTTGIAAPFALEDLKKHTPFVIEHDASISRNDFASSATGDNYRFNRTLFANSLKYVMDLGFTELNSTAMAHIRHLRETQSSIYNPSSVYNRLDTDPTTGFPIIDPSKQEFFALGEAAFILDMFGSNNGKPSSSTPFTDIAWMFQMEALPIGYQKPEIEVTLQTSVARLVEIKSQLDKLPAIPKNVAAQYWNKDYSKEVAIRLVLQGLFDA